MNMQKSGIMEIASKLTEVPPNTIPDLKVDPSFRKISKNEICFHIWRIDEEHLEAIPRIQFGTFFDDCAYIIYAASLVNKHVDEDTVRREAKQPNNLERFIHFWIGANVSKQKRANVTYKVQELDSYFDNVSTIYAEKQETESARFLSYFRKGITIRSAKMSTSKESNRLFQLRGRQWLRCVEMDSISWEHFNANYIMLLKTSLYTYVWIGRSSSAAERYAAMEVAAKQQTKTAEMTLIDDGYEQSLPEECKNLWNSLLPLNNRYVNQNHPVPEKRTSTKMKLYKFGHKSTRLHLEQLDVSIPTKGDLKDSTGVYVLDSGVQGIWLWVGSKAPLQDNLNAIGNGRAYIRTKNYPKATSVVRVVEYHEPIEFIRLFPNWPRTTNESAKANKPLSTLLPEFDSTILCERPTMAAYSQLIDDGTGDRQIYQITKDQVHECPPTKVVMFSTQNCYVVQYSVVQPITDLEESQNIGIYSIIYQWNGSEAPPEVITKCQNFAQNCFDNHPEKSMFVQMCEYDETPHFLQIFNGKLIVMQSDALLNYSFISLNNNNNNNNNNTISFNNNNNNNNNKNKIEMKNGDEGGNSTTTIHKNFVLKIFGNATYNAKAVEVSPMTTLKSKNCYIFKTNHVWVWCGQSSTGDTREIAKNVGAQLGESSLVMEGMEPKEFWFSVNNEISQSISSNGSTISGLTMSPTISNIPSNFALEGSSYCIDSITKKRPLAQLFLVWTENRKFSTLEIFGFDQRDLSPECIYVLDAGFIIFIWLGAYAPSLDKQRYLKIATQYGETVPIARRPTTAVAVIRQNHEPNVFKGFFENWNNAFWKDYICYDQKWKHYFKIPHDKRNIQSNGNMSANGENGGTLSTALLGRQKEFDKHHKFSISILQREVEALPAEVNPLKREEHLSHDDFVALFKMPFWEFDDLPLWKQKELKKIHKLF